MKRKLTAIILTLVLICTLTSCGVEAPPKILEERFGFSITYEEWGETKTISGVYVCNFAGYSFTLEGGYFTREWYGRIEGIEHAEEIYNSAVFIRNTDDGGEIYLDFDLGAAHMMGEPHLEASEIEPSFFLVYPNEDRTSETFGDSSEIEGRYGLVIVDYQYDAPVKNSFGLFK